MEQNKFKNMKKLLLLLMLLPVLCIGQTIKDRPTSIEIIRPMDTLIILKSNILYIDLYYDYVYVVLGQKDGQNKVLGGLEVKYSDFNTQFASVSAMGAFLEKAYTSEYTAINYHYTGANMDTASYLIGADTTYQKVFIYSGANVITSKVIYP